MNKVRDPLAGDPYRQYTPLTMQELLWDQNDNNPTTEPKTVVDKEYFFEPQENPLNQVKRESELMGRKMLLLELIASANRVGATVVTIESLIKLSEQL